MMRRRSFLGALLGAALPLPPLPLKPTVKPLVEGFVPVSDYIFIVHPAWRDDLMQAYGDAMVSGTGVYMMGEIGTLNGIRFIESKEIRA